jgi:dTMP kinase
MILAIEGVDGAGKNTLARRLKAELVASGWAVATISFPRYDVEPLGPVVRRMLAGDAALAELAASPKGTALLFALDRGAGAADLASLAHSNDLVLVDRYVASNAAYGAARLPPDEQLAFLDWVARVEFDDLALPRPDLQLLLRVGLATARSRAARRAVAEPGRGLDAFEADEDLQHRCAGVYERLAADSWVSPWAVVSSEDDYDRLAGRLADALARPKDCLPTGMTSADTGHAGPVGVVAGLSRPHNSRRVSPPS